MYSRFVPYESQNKEPLFRCHREHVGLCNGNAESDSLKTLQEFNFLDFRSTTNWL
jgi:hypothetical protein